MKVSLYDCFNAIYPQCETGRIRCKKHGLPRLYGYAVKRGAPLCPNICQHCKDFDGDDIIVKDNEKGWIEKEEI